MMTDHHIRDLNGLQQFVHHTICQQEQLETHAFPLTARPLARAGKFCGMFFCLHGPRSVKITAIWDFAKNTIFFYNSTGERILTRKLFRTPRLPSHLRGSA